MYICICNAVTEREVRECVRRGCCSMEQLSGELGVATSCGRCRTVATEILNETQTQALPQAA